MQRFSLVTCKCKLMDNICLFANKFNILWFIAAFLFEIRLLFFTYKVCSSTSIRALPFLMEITCPRSLESCLPYTFLPLSCTFTFLQTNRFELRCREHFHHITNLLCWIVSHSFSFSSFIINFYFSFILFRYFAFSLLQISHFMKSSAFHKLTASMN